MLIMLIIRLKDHWNNTWYDGVLVVVVQSADFEWSPQCLHGDPAIGCFRDCSHFFQIFFQITCAGMSRPVRLSVH